MAAVIDQGLDLESSGLLLLVESAFEGVVIGLDDFSHVLGLFSELLAVDIAEMALQSDDQYVAALFAPKVMAETEVDHLRMKGYKYA